MINKLLLFCYIFFFKIKRVQKVGSMRSHDIKQRSTRVTHKIWDNLWPPMPEVSDRLWYRYLPINSHTLQDIPKNTK